MNPFIQEKTTLVSFLIAFAVVYFGVLREGGNNQ